MRRPEQSALTGPGQQRLGARPGRGEALPGDGEFAVPGSGSRVRSFRALIPSQGRRAMKGTGGGRR